MKKLNFQKLRSSKIPVLITCSLFILIITVQREAISQSCIEAVNICLNVIIPTLFPIQVLTYLILNIGLPDKVKQRINRITLKLFGLSGGCAEGILLGITGGYNAAIKTAVALYKRKEISEDEAKHLSVYFSNPGISFCIMIFGSTIYKSAEIGLFVFIISNLVNMTCAFINRPKNVSPCMADSPFNKDSSFSEALIRAVNDTGRAIISICLWIIVFAVIKASMKCIIPLESFLTLFNIFSDVSVGLFIAAEGYSLPFCVFVLLSGGLCILLQQTEDMRYLKINPLKMITVKTINASVTSVITRAVMKLDVFKTIISAVSYSIKPLSGTPVSSLSLILLTAVFFSLAYEHKKNAFKTK